MFQPRSAAEAGDAFPYSSPTVCYIEVTKDGQVSWGGGAEAHGRATKGESTLYAVWPGKWSSSLFVIDDLNLYGAALGIVHDQRASGLADHEHDVRWEISEYGDDNSRSPYVGIRVTLDCGCEIRNLKAFAAQMREQKGWDIATTTGWGSGGGTYSMRARRRSLGR